MVDWLGPDADADNDADVEPGPGAEVDEDIVESFASEYEAVYARLMRSESGSFFGDCLAERRVDLCEGARVILLFNLDLEAEADQKLCNGSLGVCGAAPAFEEVSFSPYSS